MVRKWFGELPDIQTILFVTGALALAVVLGRTVAVSETKWHFAVILALILGFYIIRFPFVSLLVLLFIFSLEELAIVAEGWTLGKMLGPILAGAYLLNNGFDSLRRLAIPDALRTAIVWVAYGGLSLIWSLRPDLSLGRFANELQLLVFALLVVNMVDTPTKARRALLVFGFGAIASVLIWIGASLTGADSLASSGYAVVTDRQISTTFASVVGAGGAVFAVLTFHGPVRVRWLYAIMVILAILGILAAGGRGALVSLFAVALVLIRSRQGSLSASAGALLVVFLFVVSGWVIVNKTGLLSTDALWRLDPEVAVGVHGASSHLNIARAYLLYVFPQRPLIGSGLSTAHIAQSYTPAAVMLVRKSGRDTHNDLLQVLIDLGLIGLTLWLLVWWKTWRDLAQLRETAARVNMLDLYWAAICLLIQVFVNDLSITFLWEKRLWFALAFAMVVTKIIKDSACVDQKEFG